MNRTAMVLVATAIGAAAVGVSRDARALGPVDLEVGAKVGVGTNPFGSPIPNPLGLGLGARAGVSFIGLYGGLAFMYYLGSSADTPAGHITENAIQYGIEGGYSTGLGPLTLRGTLGVGNIQFNTGGAISANGSNLYLEPGVTLILSFGTIFVGADANVLVLPDVANPLPPGNSSWQAAFTADGQIGLKF